MAKQRVVNTKFWSDSFIRKLSKEEKLLYLYLLTNEHTEICGVYELPEDVAAFETGLDKDTLSRGIDTLSKHGKVLYLEGWIYIKNFKKHQTSSPKIAKGIEISLNKVPQRIISAIADFDTLSIQYQYPMDTQSHSNSNSNSNSKEKYKEKKSTEEKIELAVKFWNEIYPKQGPVKNTTVQNGKLMQQCLRVTPDIQSAYQKVLKSYKASDLKAAIRQYGNEICLRDPGNNYAEHRFSFYEFLSQKNGFRKFITLVPNDSTSA